MPTAAAGQRLDEFQCVLFTNGLPSLPRLCSRLFTSLHRLLYITRGEENTAPPQNTGAYGFDERRELLVFGFFGVSIVFSVISLRFHA